ncbi:MAG TPA: universal stress protein, partial [Pyrinomonadaceae bacterium]|nr:universal stress protein [Pyrinomonadaceae bacterium]
EPGTPVRILVGIDGSRVAEAALREVAQRRWPAHSEARVVIVDNPIEPTLVGEFVPSVAQSVAANNRSDRLKLQKMAEAGAKIIRSRNLKASASVEEGDPKRELPALAERWGANCIFVGATGFSNRLERFLLGSISTAVAARAHCSVEVVRAKGKRKIKSNGNGR